MKKGSFLDDTFEKLAEHGKAAVRSGAKQIVQTVSPTKILEQVIGNNTNDRGVEKLEKGQGNKPKHTPLNFDKLQKNYDSQDQLKMASLRNHLFQIVKSGEEKVMYEKKQEEEQKKQKERYEIEQKKRKELDRKRQDQTTEAPRGKIRRNIFSPRKVAERSHAETKPASGKQ